MSYMNMEVLPPIAGYFRPIIGRDPYNKKNVEDSLKATNAAMNVLEQHLLINTFLVGERLTLADLFAVSILGRGFQYIFDKAWRSANPNVTRWYETVYNQPIYSDVAGKLNFIDEAVKNQAPAKKEGEGKKQKEAAPKKEKEPAKPKAKQADNDDEEEDDAPAPPKAKHPLEALPKPTLVLDDWKRKYSNEETREVALPWFWENFKPDEYSLWKVDYKYNDELTMTFMTSNLIGRTPFLPSLRPFNLSPRLPCTKKLILTLSFLNSRRLLQPPRSLAQIHLRRRLRLRPDQRLRRPRRLCRPWPGLHACVRGRARLREL